MGAMIMYGLVIGFALAATGYFVYQDNKNEHHSSDK